MSNLCSQLQKFTLSSVYLQSIQNQSQAINTSGEVVGLQVSPEKTLALVGGNVSLDGGILQALSGRVELGGVAGHLGLGRGFAIAKRAHCAFVR